MPSVRSQESESPSWSRVGVGVLVTSRRTTRPWLSASGEGKRIRLRRTSQLAGAGQSSSRTPRAPAVRSHQRSLVRLTPEESDRRAPDSSASGEVLQTTPRLTRPSQSLTYALQTPPLAQL